MKRILALLPLVLAGCASSVQLRTPAVATTFPRKAPLTIGAEEYGPRGDIPISYCGSTLQCMFQCGVTVKSGAAADQGLRAILADAFETVVPYRRSAPPADVPLFANAIVTVGGFNAAVLDREDGKALWSVSRDYDVIGLPCVGATAEAYYRQHLQEGLAAFAEGLRERQDFFAAYPAHKRRVPGLEAAGDQALARGDKAGAFASYLEAVRGLPYHAAPYERLLDKLLPLLPDAEPPGVPEEARRSMTIAQTEFKNVQRDGDLWRAVADFERAVELAPWWPAVHFNMGVAYELGVKQFHKGWAPKAVEAYRRYLAASPDAKDAEQIRQRTYALEALK